MNITVKHGSKKSIPLMKKLWQEVFGDSDEFIDIFFTKFYRPSRTLLLFENGELVSMLYYMDVNAKYFKKKIKCAYLYGVATKLSERRRGHFRKLHTQFVEELKEKHYDTVLVMPADDSLFSFYKDFGYTVSLKRFEYRLLTSDIEEVADPIKVWEAKKEIHRASRTGLSILETKDQFEESRKGHTFFSYKNSYLSFASKEEKYVFYETVCPLGDSAPAEQVHYERSALIYDINSILDFEYIEKQKPQLSYLLN